MPTDGSVSKEQLRDNRARLDAQELLYPLAKSFFESNLNPRIEKLQMQIKKGFLTAKAALVEFRQFRDNLMVRAKGIYGKDIVAEIFFEEKVIQADVAKVRTFIKVFHDGTKEDIALVLIEYCIVVFGLCSTIEAFEKEFGYNEGRKLFWQFSRPDSFWKS